MKIGYQGIEGSNSEEAAKVYKRELEMTEAELIPLKTSKRVADRLKSGEIDYGVMAFENSIGGIVEETQSALTDIEVLLIAPLTLPIHHSIFFKSRETKKESINKVMSHIQALKQSSDFLGEEFPNAHLSELEDTAIAAKMLEEGSLADNVAIIARKNAGLMHNLHLHKENIENDSNNVTKFHLYQLLK